MKKAWTKLAFDEFIGLFKFALPKNYKQRYFKPKNVLFKFTKPLSNFKKPRRKLTQKQDNLSFLTVAKIRHQG